MVSTSAGSYNEDIVANEQDIPTIRKYLKVN